MSRKPFQSVLTHDDIEHILQLREWKRAEIARIESIASVKAIAEKFDVHYRTIERVIQKYEGKE